MYAKPVPLPTPEDLATERLVAPVESAIAVIPERLTNLAAEDQSAKWSVSGLIRLLQLRNPLPGERPRTIFACWVDEPRNIKNDHILNNNNNQPEYYGARR